jgi:hypothetical protein
MAKKSEKLVVICFIVLAFLITFILCFGIVNAIPQTSNQNSQISGEIDHYVFSRSIPEHMTIGESYTVLVFVKNTGKSHADFLVLLTTPREFIYPRYCTQVIALSDGESRRIEFPITPTKSHIGELNITASLYLLKPSISKLDSTSDSVFLIKRAFSIGDIAAVNMTILVIICGIAVIIRMLILF